MKCILVGIFLTMVLYLSGQNVGIGTTTPETKWHIVDSVNSVAAKIETLNGDIAGLEIKTGSDNQNHFRISKNNSVLGNSISLMGGLSTGSIEIGTHADMPFSLKTKNIDRLKIWPDGANGSIGIGTSDQPLGKLDIRNASNVINPHLILVEDNAAESVKLRMANKNNLQRWWDIDSKIHPTIPADDAMKIKNGNTDVAIFTGDGKMGVGVNKPSEKMHIDGNIKANGRMQMGDNNSNPTAGQIRFNPDNDDFEGYDGTDWRSLTDTRNFWGMRAANENHRLNVGSGIDWFGTSVGVYNNIVVIGAPAKDSIQTNNGAVYIYEKRGSTYVPTDTFIAPDPTADAMFGFSVDIFGSTIIVGAPMYNDSVGKVYFFDINAQNKAVFNSSHTQSGTDNMMFGFDVDINGEYAIISAPLYNIGSILDGGLVEVYKKNTSSNIWSFNTTIGSPVYYQSARFGWSVDIRGDLIAVGTPLYANGSMTQRGIAYVFSRSGSSWNLNNTLHPSDGKQFDGFGQSVCLGSFGVAVVSPFATGPSSTTEGKIYLYNLSGTSTTTESDVITLSEGVTYYDLPMNIAAYGQFIIVTTPNFNFNHNGKGSAHVFQRTGSVWRKQQVLKASDENTNHFFGASIAISNDVILVGANNVNQCYFFNR